MTNSQKGTGPDKLMQIWSRRKWLAILAFMVPFTGALSLAAFLPDLYRATTTLVVKQAAAAVASGTGETDTVLQTIGQELLSRARLKTLIDRFNLYPKLRGRVPDEALTEQMKREIQIEFKSVEEASGRGATIAFALSYSSPDRRLAAAVANTLAASYIEENTRMRGQQARDTAATLKSQLDEMKKRQEEQEKRVREFKLKHMGELPQQVETNLSMIERLNSQLALNNDKQMRAIDRRDDILKHLGEVGSPEAPGGVETRGARISRLRKELAELLSRYNDKYPDVIRLKKEIAALQGTPADEEPAERPGKTGSAVDSATRSMRDSLASINAEIRTLKAEEQNLRQSMGTFEQHVNTAPQLEQEFKEISRDYEGTKELYSTMLKRYEEAQLAESLEQRDTEQQFRVLDSAVPPTLPWAPRRLRLALAGLMVAILVAAGTVALIEHVDTSFHTLDDLRSFTAVPVLASIPPISTFGERCRARMRFGIAFLATMAGLAMLVVATYTVATGNEGLTRLFSRGGS